MNVGFWVRATISIALLGLIVSRIDIRDVAELLFLPTTLFGILLSAMALVFQGLLAGWRQVEILGLFGYRLAPLQSLRVWFSGLAISQVAFGFIAGDVVRAIQLVRNGVSRRAAGRAIVLDRIIGLAALLVMVVAVSPVLWRLTEDAASRLSIFTLGAAALLGMAAIGLTAFALPLLKRLPEKIAQNRLVDIGADLASVSRFLVVAPQRSIVIVAISIVMHLLYVLGIVVIGLSLGARASPWLLAIVAIPVMFLALLPISVAGWGIREAAMVTGFELLQLKPEIALTTSIAFGISMIIASLPGVIAIVHTKPQETEFTDSSKYVRPKG